MSASASGSFVCVSSVRALSLDPRVRGRRVAWRRSSARCSFLRVCLRPRWVFRPGSTVNVRWSWHMACWRCRWSSRHSFARVAGLGATRRGSLRRAAPFFPPNFTLGTHPPACGQQKLNRCGGTLPSGSRSLTAAAGPWANFAACPG